MWSRGDPAGQRSIVVDVEFEEMEEGVIDGGEGAIDFYKTGELSARRDEREGASAK